jgi:hypothetical protein
VNVGIAAIDSAGKEGWNESLWVLPAKYIKGGIIIYESL